MKTLLLLISLTISAAAFGQRTSPDHVCFVEGILAHDAMVNAESSVSFSDSLEVFGIKDSPSVAMDWREFIVQMAYKNVENSKLPYGQGLDTPDAFMVSTYHQCVNRLLIGEKG